MGEKSRPGDGVIAGAGRVDGRPVFCYAQDPSYLGGSLGEQHADSIVRVLRLAGRAGAPVVGFIESGGARMQEGLAALAGYARIFQEHVRLSGKIPQISVICGASAGGGSYSPALTDFVVMTKRGNMFLTGPAVVRDVMGEDVSAEDLGGYKVHERNGVAHFVADDDSDAALLVRDLIDHLPSSENEH
jgi:acetyl-CoA carboxylase carboxyltransferase component